MIEILAYAAGCLIALGIYALGQHIYTKGFEAGIKAARK